LTHTTGDVEGFTVQLTRQREDAEKRAAAERAQSEAEINRLETEDFQRRVFTV